MTTKDSLQALFLADPNRTYCVEMQDWAHVSRFSDGAPALSTEYVINLIPGLKGKGCTQIKGESLAQITEEAVRALQAEFSRPVSAEPVLV